MSWRSWGDWGYYNRPRRTVSGIKAKTQRGKFGTTWWAGRWLAALESLVDSGRLSRGRSYARSGQVTKLEVGKGGVDAEVWGSSPEPYEVTIGFQALTDAEWDAVAEAMAAEAIYAAKLLSGEMPEHIEEAFQAAGTHLFPAEAKDLETDCSCPDWANPCKHVAAVFYLLGERFDEDPFLMFELRGRTKEEIAEALRARRAGAVSDGGAAGESEAAAAPPDTLDVLSALGVRDLLEDQEGAVPLFDAKTGNALERFWSAPSKLSEIPLDFHTPEVDALPVKRLGTPPFWQRPQDFATTMEQVYKAASERARRLALEGK